MPSMVAYVGEIRTYLEPSTVKLGNRTFFECGSIQGEIQTMTLSEMIEAHQQMRERE